MGDQLKRNARIGVAIFAIVVVAILLYLVLSDRPFGSLRFVPTDFRIWTTAAWAAIICAIVIRFTAAKK